VVCHDSETYAAIIILNAVYAALHRLEPYLSCNTASFHSSQIGADFLVFPLQRSDSRVDPVFAFIQYPYSSKKCINFNDACRSAETTILLSAHIGACF
jgi:hypothetical protein